MENTEMKNDLNNKEETFHENSHAKRREFNNKLLVLVIILALVMIAGAIVLGMFYYHEESYDDKMARFEKVATDFKETLGPNKRIIAERIDSIVQKVYYLIPTEESYGNSINNIKVHDYVTNESRCIFPVSGKIEDYEFCNIEFRDSKLYKDRLFIIINSNCMWRLGSTGIFYIDIKDNSLHYVEACDEASFLGNGEIAITKFYYLGVDEEYGKEETKKEEYTLSTSLSDEAYADNRWEQKRKEERLAEEWRKRDIERVIKFDYTVYDDHRFDDHIGNLNKPFIYDMVHTKVITIPNNKVWVMKRFTITGYGSDSPVLGYHKVKNGYCENPYGPPVRHGQVFYPGQYMFSIKDLSCNIHPGHRTATIKFSEEDL